MPPSQNDTVTIEDARIIYKNFTGRPDAFNPDPGHNFAVVITDEAFAEKLRLEGWNIKFREPKEEGDAPFWYIKVEASWKIRPPRITRLTEAGGRMPLTEETISMLDEDDIIKADVIFRPYNYTVGATTGTKAYLQTMFVHIREDELEAKYAYLDTNDTPQ